MTQSIGSRLEEYTRKHPQEVLLINISLDGELDQIAIFKGVSSSLMRPTAFDPEIPVLPDSAQIITIDRLESPYHPQDSRYIQQGLTQETIEPLLLASGV